jgi:hypothetical protein
MTDETKRKAEADKARDNARKALEADQAKAGETAAKDQRSPEERATGSRQDEDDLARDTAAAQGRSGTEGLSLDQPKDTLVASPGAQFDPAAVARLPAGVTSSPLNQPIPEGMGATVSRLPDPYEFEDGENGVWGRDDRTGKVIRPRQYPKLENASLRVTKSAYFDDAVRNEGEIMHNYTGPLASWMQPIDAKGQDIPRSKFKLA